MNFQLLYFIFDDLKNQSVAKENIVLLKQNFGTALYLDKVSNINYRHAITKFRTSSHDLMIEKGRHSPVSIDIYDRLCPHCQELEDEPHFLIKCSLYSQERDIFFREINIDSKFQTHPDIIQFFCYLMNLQDQYQLEKLGEFIYHAFKKRKNILNAG